MIVYESTGKSSDKRNDLLEQILIAMKKTEYHLSIASDTELKDQDV